MNQGFRQTTLQIDKPGFEYDYSGIRSTANPRCEWQLALTWQMKKDEFLGVYTSSQNSTALMSCVKKLFSSSCSNFCHRKMVKDSNPRSASSLVHRRQFTVTDLPTTRLSGALYRPIPTQIPGSRCQFLLQLHTETWQLNGMPVYTTVTSYASKANNPENSCDGCTIIKRREKSGWSGRFQTKKNTSLYHSMNIHGFNNRPKTMKYF